MRDYGRRAKMIEVDMRNSGGMDFSLQFLLLPKTLLAFEARRSSRNMTFSAQILIQKHDWACLQAQTIISTTLLKIFPTWFRVVRWSWNSPLCWNNGSF